MASRDVILTTLQGVRFEYAANFLRSLRRTGCHAEVVVFSNRMKESDLEQLRQHGVTVVRFKYHHLLQRRRLAGLWCLWRAFFQSGAPLAAGEWLAQFTFHLFYRRHLLYLQFLRKHGQNYDRVFLSDCRDVLFQADPFSWNLPPGVHFFLEDASNKIQTERSHAIAIRNQFGEAALAEIGDETISCAGTVLGDTPGIMEYLTAMVDATMEARSLRDVCADQAIHNYLLYAKRLGNVTAHHNLEGPVMTLGMMRPADIRFNDSGLVVNSTGRIVPVLHQYDRHPAVEKKLLTHLHPDLTISKPVIS